MLLDLELVDKTTTPHTRHLTSIYRPATRGDKNQLVDQVIRTLS
jgi:hypothetical protein